MRNKLIAVAFLFVIAAVMVCCCGCGASPLAKAYDDLMELSAQGVQDESAPYSDVVDNPLLLKYAEEKDALTIKMDSTADLDKIFDVLDKDLGGKDIGTIIFLMDGTRGDGFENDLNKRMGQLDCKSVAMLGVDFDITDSELENHDWTKLANKSEALYIEYIYGLSDVYNYSKKEQKWLDNIKHVEILYQGNEFFYSYKMLKNLESISLVSYDTYNIQESEEDAETTAEEASTAAVEDVSEDKETTVAADFEYNVYTSTKNDLFSFAEMKKLNTMLIYPDTGYNLTESGQKVIASLQCIVPKLQVNKPGSPYSEDSTVKVKEIKTPDLDEAKKVEILEDLLESEIKEIYEKCEKFDAKPGDAVLNGNVLVYEDQPLEDSWSGDKKMTGVGECLINETKNAGIDAPKMIGNYKTLVFAYPTYSRTGTYTSGTGAYSKSLHVQVFDLENKIAYEAETVDSSSAPQSFTYFAGSRPDKHSGDIDNNKIFEYLKKLQKK